MKTVIQPGSLSGTVRAVASKSQAHRALFIAAFADGPTGIICPDLSQDIEASISAVETLGAKVKKEEGKLLVTPVESGASHESVRQFDCMESGTTLRFVLPMVGIEGTITEIMTKGRLGYRPLKEFGRELSRKGMAFDQIGYAVRAMNKLKSGSFNLPGNVSSQYISSLLMALPLLDGPSEIIVDGPISSASYVDMTLEMMEWFGVPMKRSDDRFMIEPAGRYHSPGEIAIEGDWSAASFWLTARALGSEIEVTGLREDSRQGDSAAEALTQRVRAGNAEIDIDATPDLLPVLAVAAAVTEGETQFVNAARLRDKESDRLETTCAMIRALGGGCDTGDDSLTVTGVSGGKLAGGTVDAAGDHRIAMSAAVAATRCETEVTISGAEAVAKSYPRFWEDYESLGGSLTDIEDEVQQVKDF